MTRIEPGIDSDVLVVPLAGSTLSTRLRHESRGVGRERLAGHEPDVLVAVADVHNPTQIAWKSLKDVLPDYWMTVFPDEIDGA